MYTSVYSLIEGSVLVLFNDFNIYTALYYTYMLLQFDHIIIHVGACISDID